MLTEILTALLAPVVTAGLTGLAVALRTRAQRRDERLRVLADLQYLDRHASTMIAYLDARERLANAATVSREWQEQTLAEMDLAYGAFLARWEPLSGAGHPTARSLWPEVLLLRGVRGRAANATRALYWLSFVWAAWIATGIAIVMEQKSEMTVPVAVLLFLLVSVAPSLGLFAATRALDRRARSSAGPDAD
jgi:hypothetical protein